MEVSWGEAKPDGELAMPSCKTDDSLSYRRLRLLGQGSFGKAFLARDLSDNELCVMKQVRLEKMDAKARDTAVREAVALRRVHHPNVVRFREVFVRSGWLCLVMDFADGGDLCAAVKERARSKVPFEESAILECFSQVADAVHFVHQQKMVHRDIKSRNIFLCRTGRALLGDFGLVRLLESTCELAHTRVGTPYYLSPEIIRKQPYNYKTDVWSLGVLMYEMTALVRPFVGTLETLPKVILKGEYAPLGNSYSQGLHELCAAMLQVDSTQRLDLATALTMPILSEPLQRSRDALGLEPPEPVQRRPKPTPKPVVEEKRIEELVPPNATAAEKEWIGYNTMVRRGNNPILPVETAQTTANTEAVKADLAGTLRTATAEQNWSLAPQRDPDSGNEDLNDASDDSWGDVVETNLDALQQAVTKAGPAA